VSCGRNGGSSGADVGREVWRRRSVGLAARLSPPRRRLGPLTRRSVRVRVGAPPSREGAPSLVRSARLGGSPAEADRAPRACAVVAWQLVRASEGCTSCGSLALVARVVNAAARLSWGGGSACVSGRTERFPSGHLPSDGSVCTKCAASPRVSARLVGCVSPLRWGRVGRVRLGREASGAPSVVGGASLRCALLRRALRSSSRGRLGVWMRFRG